MQPHELKGRDRTYLIPTEGRCENCQALAYIWMEDDASGKCGHREKAKSEARN